MADVIGKFISSVFGVILGILQCLFGAAALLIIGFLAFFFLRYRLNPFRLTVDKLPVYVAVDAAGRDLYREIEQQAS